MRLWPKRHAHGDESFHEPPTRAELWSVEQLEAHALQLALHTDTGATATRVDLRDHLTTDIELLERASVAIATASTLGRAITPSAEWLVDNFHVVTEQSTEIALRLTPRAWSALPRGLAVSDKAWPRAFGIVREYLAHTDFNFEIASFSRYVLSYQSVTPLEMRELAALDLLSRLALIDELRRLAVRTEAALAARGAADRFVDALIDRPGSQAATVANVPLVLRASLYRQPFVVQLVQRLRAMGAEYQPVLDQIAEQLADHDTTIDRAIQLEHVHRSASNLSVRNIITSLRAIAAFDWQAFIEGTSHVELLLMQHASYSACDRHTRQRYRECVEELAKSARRRELDVATDIVRMLLSDAAPPESLAADIGALLIGPRRAELEAAFGYQPKVAQRIQRWVAVRARSLYFGSVLLMTATACGAAIYFGSIAVGDSIWVIAVLGVLSLFPGSEWAIGWVNRVWMRRFGARYLPRLALAQGLTPELKTLIAVPVLLRSADDALASVRDLQVHALANPDPQLRFALLSDWTDAPSESMAEDAAILAAATHAIAALNAADAAALLDEPRFYLLHRRRQWNAHEDCFMGWERKRGKLVELNRLLLGADDTSFVPQPGQAQLVPRAVRYVVCLDADTRSPRESVRHLVGVAAHPLNRPVFDPAQQRVVQGYAVLQPRISPLLPARGEHSFYRDAVSSGSGLDPYAGTVSDLYQDVFGEGLFTGKGLYDVAMFEASLAHRVPDNTLLSHDLLEGLFARCALVADVELFEEFPSHSEVAAARMHRWTRGDWQLLPWLLGRRGSLPPLGRWKICDNLRRSLLAPASVALLVTVWLTGNARPGIWIALIVAPWLWPACMNVVARLGRSHAPRSTAVYLRQIATEFLEDVARAAVTLVLLAQDAWLRIDAISRALMRSFVTHRRSLEWITAAQVKSTSGHQLTTFVWPLLGASVIVLFSAIAVTAIHPQSLRAAAPWLVAWWLSPLVARYLSKPLDRGAPRVELLDTTANALRRAARQTWRFFEEVVGADDHHLPPDNFQETPVAVLAHRSSPTNVGMYLLSCVAAHDFGWLGTRGLATRLQLTTQTLDRLARHRGHFFNWYDTRTCAPLAPRYVSTVDSGNFAAHSITCARALREIAAGPLLSERALMGPLDAVQLCQAALARVSAPPSGAIVDRAELTSALNELRESLATRVPTLAAAARQTIVACAQAERLVDLATAFAAETRGAQLDVLTWARAIARDLRSHLDDVTALLPRMPDDLPPQVSALWRSVEHELPRDATLPATLEQYRVAVAQLRRGLLATQTNQEQASLRTLVAELERVIAAGDAQVQVLELIATRCEMYVAAMSFGFLFDRSRGLFTIGYRVDDSMPDTGYYDLLASEARLTSLLAIAKGDVPNSHWFKLGRRLTGSSRRPVLASWSGSMFEYLMPALVLSEPTDSLLDQSNRNAIVQQMKFGAQRNRPWGVSESAYNVRDRELTYQYSAFGVPTLGLKRGLDVDHVVAPYATALAASYVPQAAWNNLRTLESLGGLGQYGYYEAIDFTPRRVPNEAAAVVVRSYMAHHQGMILVALDNALHDRVMQTRFHAEPMVRATELLLQERAVRFADARALPAMPGSDSEAHVLEPDVERSLVGVSAATPVVHLLSNRNYSVMLTDSGAGYSICRARAVTRWREDCTRDAWGSFIYLRDVASARMWSAGFQPTAITPDDYEVLFKEERAVILRRDGLVTTKLEVVVAANDDAELRRVSLRNDSTKSRSIEVTSYAEVVLAPHSADVAHPAFSNLFVQTEFDAATGALLAMRRPRSQKEPQVWAAHVLSTSTSSSCPLEYETDRGRFIGRGRTARAPWVIVDGRPLSNSVGGTLDPIFSLRTLVKVPAGAIVTVTFTTLVADSREQALALASKYRHPAIFEHTTELAWTFVRAELHHLSSDLAEARLFQMLATHLVFTNRQLRAGTDVIAANRLDRSHLWRFGISGDRPILLLRCRSSDDQQSIRQCLRAQEYLRVKRLFIDVVILNEQPYSYGQGLQADIDRTIRANAAPTPVVDSGTLESLERAQVFTLRADGITADERDLLLATARVVLQPALGSLAEQLHRPDGPAHRLVPAPLTAPPPPAASTAATRTAASREFWNGLGGFVADGREYSIALEPGKQTPAPWSNVIANEELGFVVSESGSMFTWSLNSRENQLTPWSNDVVSDQTGEAIYILDEDSTTLWSPTAQPIRVREATYEARHGQGYSVFKTDVLDVTSELCVLVAPTDPIKRYRLLLTNNSDRVRRLTIVFYVEWVLGAERAGSTPSVVTERDIDTGAIFARNATSIDFGTRIAFCDLGGQQQYSTTSRREFLGRNGDMGEPAGMRDVRSWSGRAGAGFDPCTALAVTIEMEPLSTSASSCALGQAESVAAARALVSKYRATNFEQTLDAVKQRWNALVGGVQIRTPDRALDLLFNRWLLYQTISCRMWARAGFYQAGGAYGFRDQLQDCMAVVVAAPDLTRAHLLRAAARQFPQGDVQHWWHPPSGRGVRTHISDDRVWLPYAVMHYLAVTRDQSLLDEAVAFIDGVSVPAGSEDAHFEPTVSTESVSIFEHCARALDHSLETGAHGLSLMGSGDWNDGMNRVGHEGRGESVWLSWFLSVNLRDFAEIAAQRGEAERASRWRTHAATLVRACENHGWDGAWYRRAYFDDGTALGSAANEECRIDSIAQSWAVLSRAGDSDRAAKAMDSVEQYLVRQGDGLVLLFTPPFDKASVDPGYVKGYLPGLRENGGQYTHAAIWVLMAQAQLRNTSQVAALLEMLNPIRRSESRSGVQAYRVEPYVLAADIYSGVPYARRGGWTWYTGAAGWMHRAILESVLGLRIRGNAFTITPCMPRAWNSFEIRIARDSVQYLIQVVRVQRVEDVGITLDGACCESGLVPLLGDGRAHTVSVSVE